MKIEFTTTPESSDLEFLTKKINDESTCFGAATTFAFFIRDQDNQIIAGCNGSVIFVSIYTDQLWGDRKYRGTGLGKELMEAVHQHGRKYGCTLATVNTMSFHLPALYELRQTRGATVDFACPSVALQERRGKRRGYKKIQGVCF